MEFFKLDGRVAIVTGGAAGIGEAIVRRLAEAGAAVVVADLNEEKAQQVAESVGRGAYGVKTDVGDARSIAATVQTVLGRSRKIDVLVNNAGIGGTTGPIWEQTEDEWQRVIAVNQSSVFHFCRLVVPYMRAQQYGRIVNIASIAGKEGNPNMVPYSATKAAVIALTKSVGKEVATDGICVNAVAPAVVQTEILNQLTPAQVAYMTERIPMKRTGKPEEIAAVVHFLASEECSFVTGQCYDASGGRATY